MWVTSFGNGMKRGYLYPAGIDEINKGTHLLRIYPDPAEDYINIETNPLLNDGTLNIYDIGGRLISTQSVNKSKTEVRISNFPSGVYVVKVLSKEVVENGKFVKK